MTYYYYGNLKDATITEGDVSCELQYPITNINILDKNVYTYLNDNDTEGSNDTFSIVLAKIDFGEAVNVSSYCLDLLLLRIQTSTTTYNHTITIGLQYSDDDSAWGDAGTFKAVASTGATSQDETLTEILMDTFTEISHRYWRVIFYVVATDVDTLTWDIDGKINNLYIGSYAELPCPALIKKLLLHKTRVNESYAGGRSGYDNQGQRKGWIFPFNGLSETNWTAYEAFDAVCGQGALPCYVESDIVNPVFARVYEGAQGDQIAYQLYELTNRIEAEL